MIKSLADALAKQGYDVLTPVQSEVSKKEFENSDLLVSAQTGSGKTTQTPHFLLDHLLSTGEDGTFSHAHTDTHRSTSSPMNQWTCVSRTLASLQGWNKTQDKNTTYARRHAHTQTHTHTDTHTLERKAGICVRVRGHHLHAAP